MENKLKIEIRNDFTVLVFKYKFDTIRQASYWVCINKLFKQCKSLEQAEAYKARIIKEHS